MTKDSSAGLKVLPKLLILGTYVDIKATNQILQEEYSY